MRSIIVPFISLATLVSSQAAELSAAFTEKALAAMKSSDIQKRKAAYRTFQHLGPESMAGYRNILQSAQRYHQGQIRRAMGVKGNPYAEHARAAEELSTERERIMELIHTDWKKDPGKIRMLRTEFEGIQRKYKNVTKLASSKTASIDKNIDIALAALVEIEWELASIRRSEDGENASDMPDKNELADAVYEDSFEAEEWRNQKDALKATLAEIKRLEEAKKHNAACKWANGSQKDFSNHLNYERAVMGLQPMVLEERLSFASYDHSNDMRSGGFFSHTSPIPGKRTPADRARRAKFRGSWTGENIFMGSPSFMAAYNGWFGSDGHRFIMFTRGNSNVIGVGIAGNHWTMMTGKQ